MIKTKFIAFPVRLEGLYEYRGIKSTIRIGNPVKVKQVYVKMPYKMLK